ncbi:uncharacterized protein PV09_00758 [Verruconis gallopava]|uniref:Uncharacterized protein n=1 Tax=Verruconis gallopava TaxID=253628 RepID=A0A0D2AQ70_9PEZI|nr:uncharacterized protein PV09_00758 [Verruconis gallopava]KIW08828.1 hypothetical protein PV09_00758 [Verruconis gallopava]
MHRLLCSRRQLLGITAYVSLVSTPPASFQQSGQRHRPRTSNRRDMALSTDSGPEVLAFPLHKDSTQEAGDSQLTQTHHVLCHALTQGDPSAASIVPCKTQITVDFANAENATDSSRLQTTSKRAQTLSAVAVCDWRNVPRSQSLSIDDRLISTCACMSGPEPNGKKNPSPAAFCSDPKLTERRGTCLLLRETHETYLFVMSAHVPTHRPIRAEMLRQLGPCFTYKTKVSAALVLKRKRLF